MMRPKLEELPKLIGNKIEIDDIPPEIKDVPISDNIVSFLQKFHGPLATSDFENFRNELNHNPQIKKCILGWLVKIVTQAYQDCNISSIIKNISNGNNIIVENSNPDSIFILLNAFILSNFIQSNDTGFYYYSEDLPFAFNALKLTGQLPNEGHYINIDLNKPLYPRSISKLNNRLSIQKGIKNSNEYFPIKKIIKANVVPGDACLLASNGKKLVYIRCNEKQSTKNKSESIFASKIAKFVSYKHFSSERLLSNTGVASRHLEGYSVPLTDYWFNKEIAKLFTKTNKIITGAGTIDEVCIFTGEHDTNLENFGISSNNLLDENTYFTKIDFDNASLSQHRGWVKSYILNDIYLEHGVQIENIPQYINERLSAKLKLSFLTNPILTSIANKSYCIENSEEETQEKLTLIKTCENKSSEMLKEFLSHPETKNFLLQNGNILNQLYCETIDYIQSHFDEKNDLLLESLKNRIKFIQERINHIFELSLDVNWNYTSVQKLAKQNDVIFSPAPIINVSMFKIKNLDTKGETFPTINIESNNISKNNLTEFKDLKLSALQNKCDELINIYKKDIEHAYHKFATSYRLNMGANSRLQTIIPDHVVKTKFEKDNYTIKTINKITALKEVKASTSIQDAEINFNKNLSIFNKERDKYKTRLLRGIVLILTAGLSYGFSDAKNMNDYFTRTRSTTELNTILNPTSSKKFK